MKKVYRQMERRMPDKKVIELKAHLKSSIRLRWPTFGSTYLKSTDESIDWQTDDPRPLQR